MEISVELTLSPLSDDFESEIKTYIKALRESGLKLIETPLCTQVYGEYDTVFSTIERLTKTIFDKNENILLNIKIVKGDRSTYEPFN